ncbi:enoyl-CoA hydratase [Noviherbaspirillum sedimenti]|uniref:Enoyl-CoA hydratase n=1 Tax=Noviherbaspirillum sedimenti TaxID=2320865 RepID=A0A3A3FZ78_9BURK|nr:enoyl-CoA hydratase [Noviherbaspirillum sedimenti]RJG00951.1 enoyl-CoA hydratase [Noviherbaspirillum sedimenti]
MNNYTNLQIEIAGHTAVVTLSNPSANTFTRDGLIALTQLVHDLDANREIVSLVLTGQGEKFFSAGADLKQFADGDKAMAREMARRFGEAFEALSRFRGVTIAAINGYAMGGGLECALACDIRIAEEQAQMALPEAAVGLLPCAGGTQNLSWLVGEGWAKRMVLLGERISAATALQIGLVEEVVPAGQAKERALALAKLADRQSPISIAACKRLIQGARHQPLAQVLPQERETFVNLFDTHDQQEGVNAFLQKRAPQWRNA